MKFALLLPLLIASALPAAEVFEAALGREAELPKGKEADGILGDFVLRSDKVEAVISHNAPNRRANMSTFYGEDGVSPGCLYDLTLRGANNDQLVAYGPCGHGSVSYVKIANVKEDGAAAVESVTTAAKNGGVFKRHEYRVKDGAQGIFITTVLRNESGKPQKVNTKSDFTRFDSTGMTSEGIFWVDAINPAHKCGYALGTLNVTGIDKLADTIEMQPKQEVVISRFFAVGTSPAQAVGEVRAVKGVKVGTVTGKITGADGKGIATTSIQVPDGKKTLTAYPDAEGSYSLKLPLGPVELQVTDLGRSDVKVSFTVAEGTTQAPKVTMPNASGIHFAINDESGKPIPCKAHFAPLDENAAKLNLGPKWRAHGSVDLFH
ncbi:MAG TPA: carboxypeptidase regulatory-like domain-containing protein, partial [Prosthecobacter sp.]|nr:carboxypeptidase regulatory-like domain-containing protein [Prosthecobacter sp.]